MTTTPLFLQDTYLFAFSVKILSSGKDENGSYFVTDRSIFYPQGGGQPGDNGYISIDKENQVIILFARYTDTGIRHYVENEFPNSLLSSTVCMHIFQIDRLKNAAYHSAGHWISQLILENMQLPLFPIKGHHHPNEAYIEFEGDTTCITPDSIAELKMAMLIDLQANLKIKVQLADEGSKLFESALLPKNFKPPVNKPLRFTQIEGYRWLPCGGTHLNALREIKSVTPLEFQNKGGKIRLKYQCEMTEMIIT